MKKTIILFLILSLVSILTGCRGTKIDKVSSSQDLYVRKIANIPDDFIMGMDVSSLISLEKSGVVFHGYDEEEADLFKVLVQSGITHIRVRIWNDPHDGNGNGYGGGNCDIANALEIGRRASGYGLKLIVDFHYSDFWADPGKQMVPKAWRDMDIESKADALYEYTKQCLEQFKKEKIDVALVQLGNETNGALCGENVWMNIVWHLMVSGSKAVREIYPKALVAVHFANPENKDAYMDYAKKLDYYGLDYDVFATSYYPYWHSTLSNLREVLNGIHDRYGKKTMIMETSYAYTSEDTDFSPNTISDDSAVTKDYPYSVQGQANCILDIIEAAVNSIGSCIGVCYWEGAWITVGGASREENQKLWETYGSGWASSFAAEYDPDDAGKYYGGSAVDNQTFFDEKGYPLESLKLFELCRTGNVIPLKTEAIEDTYLTFDVNDEIILPDRVNAVMSDNSRSEINVVWNDFDPDVIKTSDASVRLVEGSADGLKAKCFISIVEQNYIENHSFEDDPHKTAVPSSWSVDRIGNMDELYVETKKNDSRDGENHLHFWSSKKDSVEFRLEQEVKDLKPGSYRYFISIMGGDAGNSEIYSYVKINGKIIARDDMKITSYNEWDEGYIEFEYDGTSKLTVGIFVKCSGEGSGAWGKIDDARLNAKGE